MRALEHLARLQELLRLEKEEDLRQYRELVLDRSLEERVKTGVTWFPAGLKRLSYGLGERVVVELAIEPERQRQNNTFQVGSIVSLFGMESGGQLAGKLGGVVASLREPGMRIALGVDYVPDWLTEARLGVDLDFDDRTYQDMQHTLRQVIDAKRDTRLYELREILLGDEAPEVRVLKTTYQNPALNPSQNRAVQHVLEAHDVAIIHGPPGTGKTTTLVAAIREVLTMEHQVLVCAPSNTAVDLLTLKCIEAGLEVLRLGNPARVEEELLQHTLDGSIARHKDYPALRKLRRDADAMRERAHKFKRKYGTREQQQRREMLKEARELSTLARKFEDYLTYQVLQGSQVIAATLSGSSNNLLQGRQFHTVFVDEAAQALEPQMWIPLLRSRRLVMAGDHCQLPPTVKSAEAERGGLGRTLFELAIEHKTPGVMLEQQYRMHERIMGFPARQFYADRLIADAAVRDRTLGPGFEPVEFVDTAGCGFEEQIHPETLSTSNPEEAQLLLRHLAMLLNRIQEDQPHLLEQGLSIGIIAPYKYQVRTLQRQLLGSPMLQTYARHIGINTVDGFQGQERDIIYLSMVRANRKAEIGFLRDIRRMNVALTRARKKLVVFGDSATLGEHTFYEDFLRYAEEIGAYRSAWEFMET
ncbi:MAG: AAA domain-containing protein [Bacteroidia bacterium]